MFNRRRAWLSSFFIKKYNDMKFRFFSIFIAAGIALTACSKSDDPKPESPDKPNPEQPENPGNEEEIPTTAYGLTQLELSTNFAKEPGETVYARQTARELSGVAASRVNPGLLYVHEDSKRSPILITNAQGEDLGKIVLDGQATLDPEDIAVGPGPEEGKSYIYFADIGDNDKVRGSIAVYRFEEPVLLASDEPLEIHPSDVTKIVLHYPEAVYNAETFLVDPITKDWYILTKENMRAKVFKATYPQTASTSLTQVLNMRSFDLFTSGDISADGTEILLRNKGQIWYWERDPAKSIVETLLEAPFKAPYAGNERQGEGVAFAADGSGFLTNTEVDDFPDEAAKQSFYGRQ